MLTNSGYLNQPTFCRLNTGAMSGSYGSLFLHARPNTTYEAIYRNNMDNSSFDDLNEFKSISKTIHIPNQAYFGTLANVLIHPEMAICKVNIFKLFKELFSSIQ